jgi:methylmalonyl-CoA mutase N-terminal domain/subunit
VALRDASAPASTNPRLMPLIIDAVRARATVGEIAETLAANWGFYRP